MRELKAPQWGNSFNDIIPSLQLRNSENDSGWRTLVEESESWAERRAGGMKERKEGTRAEEGGGRKRRGGTRSGRWRNWKIFPQIHNVRSVRGVPAVGRLGSHGGGLKDR